MYIYNSYFLSGMIWVSFSCFIRLFVWFSYFALHKQLYYPKFAKSILF